MTGLTLETHQDCVTVCIHLENSILRCMLCHESMAKIGAQTVA